MQVKWQNSGNTETDKQTPCPGVQAKLLCLDLLIISFHTRTGMMWLGQWITGSPESISNCRISLTLL